MESPRSEIADARARYATLKQMCEALVERWEWASFSLYEPDPFYYERHHIGRGKRIEEPAVITSELRQYGFDSHDRIVVARTYTKFSGKFKEEFFVYSDNAAYGALFTHSADKEVINVTQRTFEGGRVISRRKYGSRGYSIAIYGYDGDRITLIQESGGNYGKEEHAVSDEIEYDDCGGVSLVKRTESSGDKKIIFQRPQDGQGIDALAKIVAAGLVSLIPQQIRSANITDRAYSVVISFAPDTSAMFPPFLGVGLEKLRQTYIPPPGLSVDWSVWNPVVFGIFDKPSLSLAGDADFSAACRMLNQQLTQRNDFITGEAVLHDVARQLMHTDWSGVLDFTDDFVVFATDMQMSNPQRNLAMSVPPERLALLRARGWIGEIQCEAAPAGIRREMACPSRQGKRSQRLNKLPPRSRWRIVRKACLVFLLLACAILPFGCNADTLVLGGNHDVINPGAAKQKIIQVEGRSVEIWIARSPGATGHEPQAFVLYFIGKGDRADRWLRAVAASWGDKPVELWGMNYPGSGGSDGPVRIDRVGPNALAVYDAAKAKAGARPIFVQGGSFGTTVALCVAARRHVDGVILQNPPPLRQLIVGEYSWWNFGLISRHIAAEVPADLDSIANGSMCDANAILMSAGNDRVIPPRYHRMVIDAYAGPKRVIDMPGRGHDDALSHEAAEQQRDGRDWLWRNALR